MVTNVPTWNPLSAFQENTSYTFKEILWFEDLKYVYFAFTYVVEQENSEITS